MSLNKIQFELKAPKTNFNNFGKYKYRSCEDILESLKPLLAKYNAIITLSDEIVEIAGRVYVKATATYKDEKDEIKVCGFARESENKKGMDESQVTGTASSYARKYALNGLFAIDDTRDADSLNTEPDYIQKEQKSQVINNDEIAELSELMDIAGTNIKNFLAYFKITELRELKKSDFQKAKAMLCQKINSIKKEA